MAFNPIPLDNVPSGTPNTMFKPVPVHLPISPGGTDGLDIDDISGLQAALDLKATVAALNALTARVEALEQA